MASNSFYPHSNHFTLIHIIFQSFFGIHLILASFPSFHTHSYHFPVIHIIRHSFISFYPHSNHSRVILLRNDLYYSFAGHSCYEWLGMPTNIILHGMTGMRQKWDEWHRNDGMRKSLRQPNRHLIQLILMSFVSFRHHPIAVYNGDDSLMTPKWGPRQARSWQLSLYHHDQIVLFPTFISEVDMKTYISCTLNPTGSKFYQ